MARKPKEQSADTATLDPAITPDAPGEILDANEASLKLANEAPHTDHLPDDEDAAKAQYSQPTTRVAVTNAEPVKIPDPKSRTTIQWPDGYQIHLQESISRDTIELQFGNGTKADLPQAFDEIKPILKANGFNWNGGNAWEKHLVPVLGSQTDRLRARDENHKIRARVEDVVLPAVVTMEENRRGEIDITDETRQRIERGAASAQGR